MTENRKLVTIQVPKNDPILEAIIWGYITHREKEWYDHYSFEGYWGGKYTEFLIPAEDVQKLKDLAQTCKEILNGEVWQ